MRDLGLQAASDLQVLTLAEKDNRIMLSADTDFGTLLASWPKPRPSLILFRRGTDRRPAMQLSILEANLGLVADELEEGSVVVFEHQRIRIRRLPLAGV